MAISDERHRIMPTIKDRKSGHVLDYKEAVLLTNPTKHELKGEISTHYVGEELALEFENEENWKKVFGPVYVYLNSDIAAEENPSVLYDDAKETVPKLLQIDPQSTVKKNSMHTRSARHGEQSERLLQQYVEDMYIKIEMQRIAYFHHEQQRKVTRMESLQVIVESLGTERHSSTQNINRKVVLPSFIGAPNDMRKRYIEAVTSVQRTTKL